MGFSGNHLTSDAGENLPRAGTPGDLLAAFTDGGDEAAFAEIVRRYAGMVFATCLKSTKDAHDAEDATQAVFLSLAVQCKTGKTVRALGPWLKMVAKRAGLDVRKSRRRRERREQAHAQNTAIELGCPDGVLGTPAPRITEFSQAASDPEELQRLVSQELNGLPATYRLPLISQYFGGLSQKQIATQLGIKPGAVAVRIHRGRVMLAKRLQSLGAELPPGWTCEEEDSPMCASIGPAVSAMMIARIAESMGQLGFGSGSTVGAKVSTSIFSIARTAAAGAAAAAKLKIAIAVLLFVGLSASATAWAKNYVNVNIDFNGFSSLKPIIEFFRNFRGPRLSLQLEAQANQPSAAPAASVAQNTGSPSLILPPLNEPTLPDVRKTVAAVAVPASGSNGGGVAVSNLNPSIASSAPMSLPDFSSDGNFGSGGSVKNEAGVDLTSSLQMMAFASTGGASGQRELASASNKNGGSRIATGNVEYSQVGSIYSTLSSESGSVITAGGQLSIGSKVGASGTLTLKNYNFTADAQNIGSAGTGKLVQDGGYNTAQQIVLAAGPTGSAEYDLTGAAILRPSNASAGGAVGMTVGGMGDAKLHVGNATKPGLIFEPFSARSLAVDPAAATFKSLDAASVSTVPTAAVGDSPHLIVRSSASGSGTIDGWGGAVGQGTFDMNGKVIANGYGHERSLIFDGYSSVTNTIDNTGNEGNGWYAENLGRLRLPKIRTEAGTHTYTWGESSDDSTLDLVNSARVTLHNMPAADSLEIDLLDKNRSDVPTLPTGHTFIGIWSFDTLAARPSTVDLTVRYDDALAQQLNLNEGALKLWEYDNGQWIRLDHDPSFVRDTPDHILSVTADGGLTFFAVSAPEPGAAGMILLFLGSATLRRRRRRS